MSSRSLLVFCGPSGVGKSTVLKYLFKQHPEAFKFSVSHTTRKPRAGEEHGREYYFVPAEEFESMIAADQFIEHTKFASNHYGTSKMAIEAVQKEGKICILDVDWQGVLSVRRLQLDCRVVFMRPPSVSALRMRLTGRGTESSESLDERLKQAEEDMAQQARNEGLCDLTIVNDDINATYKQIDDFIFGLQQ